MPYSMERAFNYGVELWNATPIKLNAFSHHVAAGNAYNVSFSSKCHFDLNVKILTTNILKKFKMFALTIPY